MSIQRNTDTNNPLPMTEAELQGRISQAIAQHETLRSVRSGGTSGNNPPNGCTCKQFLSYKPRDFDGTGGAIAFVRWVEKTDYVLRFSKCAPEHQVTYIAGLFLDGALSWWNLQVQTMGETAAYALTWDELKERMRKRYCSRAEVQKLETELWNLKMEGPKITEYVQRFDDLSQVASRLVKPESRKIEHFIGGLAPQILSLVTTSKPLTITEAIDLSVALTEEAIRLGKFSTSEEEKETPVEPSGDNKRKFANFKKGTRASNKKKAKKGKDYMGILPKCDNCLRYHVGRCKYGKCDNCGKRGHPKETCRQDTERRNGGHDGSENHEGNNDNDNYQGRTSDKQKHARGCFNCGSKKHFRKYCPKNNQAQG
ncbi:putative transcription factor interactor and regulator CCHC(Zn) family [Helianthus annuus]|nr:putative transcription factor interactor and regulator CCHC(Zn) family [Helianthus annuus]KAJ0781990.1 putative transcription factor interactor and regulator CCHC(Zn) family [Helianthus annuus]